MSTCIIARMFQKNNITTTTRSNNLNKTHINLIKPLVINSLDAKLNKIDNDNDNDDLEHEYLHTKKINKKITSKKNYNSTHTDDFLEPYFIV